MVADCTFTREGRPHKEGRNIWKIRHLGEAIDLGSEVKNVCNNRNIIDVQNVLCYVANYRLDIQLYMYLRLALLFSESHSAVDLRYIVDSIVANQVLNFFRQKCFIIGHVKLTQHLSMSRVSSKLDLFNTHSKPCKPLVASNLT